MEYWYNIKAKFVIISSSVFSWVGLHWAVIRSPLTVFPFNECIELNIYTNIIMPLSFILKGVEEGSTHRPMTCSWAWDN